MRDVPLFIRLIDGKGKQGNFAITMNPQLNLDPNKQHFLALDQLNMSYNWHNTTPRYNNNNKIRYSKDSGMTWVDIVFPSGIYSHADIGSFVVLLEQMKRLEQIEAVIRLTLTYRGIKSSLNWSKADS